jgi:hypothetical protein
MGVWVSSNGSGRAALVSRPACDKPRPTAAGVSVNAAREACSRPLQPQMRQELAKIADALAPSEAFFAHSRTAGAARVYSAAPRGGGRVHTHLYIERWGSGLDRGGGPVGDRERGGTGRRAGFRFQWESREGSSPSARTSSGADLPQTISQYILDSRDFQAGLAHAGFS